MGDGRSHGRRGGSYQRRGGSRSHSRGYGYGSYYRSPFFYYGLGYPFSWWVGSNYGPYGGYGYGPYGDGYGGGGSYYRAGAVSLDLDISPEEAQIFVDGKLVGIADNYDGFPRYLWLDAGTHNLVIYHEGYETLGKRITLEPGDSLRLKDKMVAGTAKSAAAMYAQLNPTAEATTRDTGREQLAPWRFKDRDGDEAGASAEVARRRPRTEAGVASPRSREDWRQRGGSARSADVDVDLRSKPARVEFVVEPADAAIYVDGELIGSAAQLAELGQPVLLDAGEHVVEVSRPGFKDQRTEFKVESGETETVAIRLERTP